MSLEIRHSPNTGYEYNLDGLILNYNEMDEEIKAFFLCASLSGSVQTNKAKQ
jgi:hypothetical protein